MRFSVRFKIDNRYGKASVYSLREICVSIVDRWSLREKEIEAIVALNPGMTVNLMGALIIQRLK